jgi:hypothetical protein
VVSLLGGGVAEIDSAPFDIEDTIGRTAGHRGVNAAGAARVTCATGIKWFRAQVVPVREDCVVVARGCRGCPWQANIRKRRIEGRELSIAVRRHIDRVKRLVVQRVRERQCYRGYQIILVIPNVRRARHDATAYLRYVVMILRRTARDSITSRESRISIASYSCD